MSPLSRDMPQAVSALARVVDLTNVRVVSFGARLLESAPPGELVTASVDSEVHPGIIPGGFVVEGNFTLTAKSSVEGARDFLELRYQVGAVYRVPDESLPPLEVLNAFAETNGMVHLWPYFRAFVQQVCGQLAIPVIILQPFRVVSQESSPESSTASPVL